MWVPDAPATSSCVIPARWRPASTLALNDIARVRLRVSRELAVDPYSVNHATGAFILVDEASNETVGAGMVLAPAG